jgi:heme-degrading monooxygenase HmoA
MAVKVLIKRKVPKGKEVDLVKLITRLRTMATRQPGYISGETMRNVQDREEYLVISTWQSAEDWEAWKTKEERETIQADIDALLGETTRYEIYQYPEKVVARLSDFEGWEGG